MRFNLSANEKRSTQTQCGDTFLWPQLYINGILLLPASLVIQTGIIPHKLDQLFCLLRFSKPAHVWWWWHRPRRGERNDGNNALFNNAHLQTTDNTRGKKKAPWFSYALVCSLSLSPAPLPLEATYTTKHQSATQFKLWSRMQMIWY